ncbi:ABC transporter substrate-binding protein [Paenibacillus crassostreae]|uniref:ABC transporter substrate-binding protein n=1 Tax=Paenibacillus crassostreae TaxID=1763538 RepID=A0A162KQ03_9BACL|nr:ABC transporter substrate-binding protein [Paenibacillus crassostreae]AOZ92898.1 hypothetical protein LPB68_12185 [Paenibacillus crassostreae]OAB72013.1 hypothetical protein PNBC_18710 [Paenibacillus crassostreae]
MKKNTVRVTFFILLIAMLVGCSNSGNNAIQSGNEKESPTASQAASPQQAAPTEVTFWHVMGGANGESLDAIVEQYNNTVGKDRGIHVTSVYQGTELMPKIKTVVQVDDTKNMPDIALVQGFDLTYMSELSYLKWAEDLMQENPDGIQKKDLFPNSIEMVSYQDRLMGVPFSNSAILLYYNKDMFREANLDPEKSPETITELADYAAKLTVKDGDQITRHGLVLVPDRWHISNWIGMMDGGSFIGNNESGRSGKFTEAVFGVEGTMTRFLTEYDKLVKSGGLQHIDNNQREEFIAGKHAMIVQSSSRINEFTASSKDKFELGVAPLPLVDATSNGGIAIGGGSLYTFDRGNQESIKASWDFINYVASAEVQFTWHESTGYIPVNMQTYELDTMNKHLEEKPAFNVPIDSLLASNVKVQEPFDPVPVELSAILKEVIIDFVEQKLTIDEATKEMVTRSNDALDNYYKANPIQ